MPDELTTNVSSGSGTSQVESLRMFTLAPCPTTRLAVALKNTSGLSYNRGLGELFYHLLHRQNIERQSLKKIEVAENNQKERIYGWTFYTTRKWWWWWTVREYLDPEQSIKANRIQSGTIVYVERIKVW